MPVPLLPPPQQALMPEPLADSDSQQDSPVQGGKKKQQQEELEQPVKDGRLAVDTATKHETLTSAAQQDLAATEPARVAGECMPAERASKPPAKVEEHDDNTAAALLLGMGSKSDSDGGGSAGSSGRNKTNGSGGGAVIAGVAGAARRRQLERGASNGAANGAAGEEEDEETEEEEDEEEGQQQQRGSSGGRSKGQRSSGCLRRSARQGRTPAYRASELLGSGSDDEFDPGTKRAAKAIAGAGRTPTTVVPQKSELTLLCERFQQQFGHLQADGTPNMLMLNDVAEALGVPRRRLYDVINVFESIEVMRRVGKLMYEWVGFDHLPGLLEQLAEDETNGVPVEDRIRRAPTLIIVNEQGEEIGSGKGNSHSLWVLSRRLVRMLLKQQGPIALTAAAAVLVGPGGVSDPSKHRSQTQITVERRLYDIGSILCSVGLLERIYMKKRQPAFEWIYGWRPGDSHDPPKLPNRVASADDNEAACAAGASRAGRKRAAKAAATTTAGGSDTKKMRSVAELSAEAMVAATGGMPMGAMPFGMSMAGFGPMMMPPPGMAMAGGPPGASPAMFMGSMAGMSTMSDDKAAAMNGMQMAPFFAPPGAFFASPMMQMNGMGMAMPAAAAAAAEPSPPAPEAAGPIASGDGAAPGGGVDGAAAAMAAANGMGGVPPGMMMWHPQMAMMNPAMMQQYQMQQAAMMKSSEQMQQQVVAVAGGKPGGMSGVGPGPSPFPGMMMAPAGMMMAPYPMMQPMQASFVPVGAGVNGAAPQ